MEKTKLQQILTSSENMSREYCCTIVKIDDVNPIEGSDFLGTTMVEGRTIVVRKDQVKPGDLLFYVSNECQIASDFLYINNLYENWQDNANAPEIEKALEEIRSTAPADEVATKETQYIKTHKGYFNDKGRVRMVKLRGVISMGYLFGLDEMKAWCPAFDITPDELEPGLDFDTVNGVLFVKPYVPKTAETESKGRQSRDKKRNKKIAKFDVLIPGQFAFHYDTNQLNREMYRIKPDDVVDITTKIHGTSIILANVLTKAPRWGGLYEKLFVKLPKFLQFTKQTYKLLYSSRNIIRNQFIVDENTQRNYYTTNVYKEWGEKMELYIPYGMTIYGEVCGYETNLNKLIQHKEGDYDYGCKPGENRLVIYRITSFQEDGKKKEWTITEVRDFTEALIAIMKAKGDETWKQIMPLELLYHGTLQDLYPDVNLENHWHANVLEKMKNDHEHFHMEEMEYLCRHKAPREGIVLRIENDPIAEAFKLKCLKYLGKEADAMDKGIVDDVEMEERYGGDDDF